MKSFTNTAFLCAYFSYNPALDIDGLLCDAGWTPVRNDKQTVESYKQYFYPEFVNFLHGSSEETGMRKYTLSTDKIVYVANIMVKVKEMTIYVMPYGMALYAIHTEMESDSLNDFTLALYKMREMRLWSEDELREFQDAAITPIQNAAKAMGKSHGSIVENGNKLKIFQIVTSINRSDYPNDLDTTLFELGTLGKIGGCKTDDPNSPSKLYINNIINDSRLSYYNNWNGLALFDTFSIMAYDVAPWVSKTWKDDYFAMIYIHSLFCKFYLFKLNERFRLNPEQGEQLENEYHEFERLYTFPKISYNFLPGEINKAIDEALEISEEKKYVAEYISNCNKVKADKSSRHLDRILTFLALVTVFSTIWDFTSMLNAMWPFHELAATVESGFRVAVSLTMLGLTAIIISLLRKP